MTRGWRIARRARRRSVIGAVGSITCRLVPPAVVFDKVSFAFDDHVVLRRISSFSVPKGSMKTPARPERSREIRRAEAHLGLLQPDSGTILVNDRVR